MTPHHLGDLHAYEQLLVAVVAFGPFVLLALVVHVVRRRELAEEERASVGSVAGAGEPGAADLSLAGQRRDEDPLDE